MAHFDDELDVCVGEEAKDENDNSGNTGEDNSNSNEDSNSGSNVGNTGQQGSTSDGSPLRPQPNWGIGGLSVDNPNSNE